MDKRIPLTVADLLADMDRYRMLLALLVGVTMVFFWVPGAYFTMAQNTYLPLHTGVEFFSVLVAFMIFGVTWHSFAPARSNKAILLGCAMLASGALDFAHTLSYTGMPDFVTPSSPEKSIAFWLAARLTVAFALCGISFTYPIPRSKSHIRYGLLFGFSLYTCLIYWLVLFHQPVLPRMFIEGQGLTPFKIAFEWGIIGLLVIAACSFWRHSGNPVTHNLKTYYFLAAIIFIMSEMFFTRYKTMNDAFITLGHIYKIVGYIFLYRAVFVTTIQIPYREIERLQTRYQQLFENMTSCCVVYQAVDNGNDFIFLEANHAVEVTELMPRDKFIGRRVTELFPSVAAFGMLDILRRVWSTGQPEQFPVNYYQDERIAGWRENNLYRLADDNIVVIYDDVSERKLAELALRDSEKNYRVIFETAAIGMVEVDPGTGQFVRVNLSFCRMTGYSEQELLSKTVAMITHPDDLAQYREVWRSVLAGKDSRCTLDKRFMHKDGHEVLVQLDITALRDENGRALRVLTAVTDITERKRMITELQAVTQNLQDKQEELEQQCSELENSQTALQESSDRYMDLFDFAPIGYLTLTDKGLITEINLTGATLLGVDRKTALHRCIGSFLHPKECDRWYLHNQRTLTHGEKQSGEFLIQREDSTVFYALIDCQCRETLPSPMVRLSFTDINERKLLEQQLQQAQKMEVLGQLTGGIAHDFNNILAAVLGYANLAQERCVANPSDKLARYLGEIISASERARDLIAKMLAYSRTVPREQSAPLDLAPEVEKTIAMLSAAIPACIKVITRIEPDVPLVRIDPIEMQQVLINLAVNSRDAISDDIGYIEITLKRDTVNRKVCAICHNIIDGEYVALEVRDSGRGIPDNLNQRIFDPFFTTKDIGKGSGLGLSMVQGAVIKNNAHLLLESHLGQGASFRLLFPAVDYPAVTSLPSIAAQNLAMTKYRHIWVVEDQAFLAAYYLELLHGQGYLVTIFTNPVDALRVFKLDSDQVDLVLTDQTMPDMSGADMAELMLGIKKNLPVVMITGYNEKIDADKAISLGIRCFLKKPVEGKKLLDILATELCRVESQG